MRELWLKTWRLVRGYPVLWLPYLCAELLAFSLSSANRLAHRPIFNWFAKSTSRSVLGGQTMTYDLARAQREAIFASVPLQLATRYVNACLFTAALVVIAALVAAILSEQRVDWASARIGLRVRRKRILLYALQFCVLMLIVAGVFSLPPIFIPAFQFRPGRWGYSLFDVIWALLLSACVAWIMAPLAVKLLRPPDQPAVDAEQKKVSRYAALIAASLTAMLQLLGWSTENHLFFHSRIEITAVSALINLVVNLPLPLLFVALALIAGEAPVTIETDAGFHLPKSLKNLMPLHYRSENEAE
jgi:hypothetical protein